MFQTHGKVYWYGSMCHPQRPYMPHQESGNYQSLRNCSDESNQKSRVKSRSLADSSM
jgi:hypothetical protein